MPFSSWLGDLLQRGTAIRRSRQIAHFRCSLCIFAPAHETVVRRFHQLTCARHADTPLEAGVDVAEGGDNKTVLVVRQGAQIVLRQAWAHPDPRGAPRPSC